MAAEELRAGAHYSIAQWVWAMMRLNRRLITVLDLPPDL